MRISDDVVVVSVLTLVVVIISGLVYYAYSSDKQWEEYKVTNKCEVVDVKETVIVLNFGKGPQVIPKTKVGYKCVNNQEVIWR